MARVKASAPEPELILPLVEVGEEMALACELCNHPKATAIRPDFIDRLLEVGWSSVRIEFMILHDCVELRHSKQHNRYSYIPQNE
jgi:hypothetical protein